VAGRAEVQESQAIKKRFWDPSISTVERVPNNIVVSYEQPGIMRTAHWHAQIEVNYVVRGEMRYKMYGHSVTLKTGDICLFWGGLPHQVVDTTENAFFYAFHLPLLNFFRLHLPEDVPQSLMHGATLVMQGDGAADIANFQRWSDYLRSSAVAKRNLAIDELLLRIERTRFEPFALVRPRAPGLRAVLPADQHAFGNVWRICEYITENFREDIDSTDIANSEPNFIPNMQ
jgi:hypothetical protein